MKTFAIIMAIITILLITIGCSATYEAPTSSRPVVSTTHHSSVEDITKQSMRVLVSEGYRIDHVDKELGLISTEPRKIKLSPEYANCGTTMGIDYLKDKRTETEVSISVLIDKRRVEVQANIDGQYKPGDVTQDIRLTCVSKGTLERRILSRIVQ